MIYGTAHATSVSLACIALLIAACAVRAPLRDMTVEECRAAETCRISGLLTMSSDGHGFIAELEVAGDKCVNVSLPVRASKAMLGKPPKQMSVQGAVVGFPAAEDLAHFTVDGRRIGFGRCGDFFVFVE